MLVAEVHNQVTASLVPPPSLGGSYLPCERCFYIRPIAVCLLIFSNVLDVLWIEVDPPMSVAALLCRCRARQGPDPARQRRSFVDHDPVPTEAEN